MKKAMMASMLTTGLIAGGTIANIYDEPAEKNYYTGVTFGVNETFSRNGVKGFEQHLSDEFTDAGIGLVFGYKFQEFDEADLSAEIRVGQSFWMEDSENVSIFTAGAYLKANWQVNYVLGLYGLLGVNYADYSGEFYSSDYAGISAGLGLSLRVAPEWTLFTDYTYTNLDAQVFPLTDDADLGQFVVGALYKW